MNNAFVEEVGRHAARRQHARAGRNVKGVEASKRELQAAGQNKPSGLTFNYPTGAKIGAYDDRARNVVRHIVERIPD